MAERGSVGAGPAVLATLKGPKLGEDDSKRTGDLLTSERFGKYPRKGAGVVSRSTVPR